MRTQGLVYLSTGSNLGKRKENLFAALDLLSKRITLHRFSSLYETKPWGFADQPNFLNQVVEGKTSLSPQELKDFIKESEIKLGRTPSFQYGPRLIDIDILFYDDLILNEADLIIPHPRIPERAFVLVPLAEIAPNWVHPALHLPVKLLLEKVDTAGVKLYPSALDTH